jgi:predicted nucleic acid-binding protein
VGSGELGDAAVDAGPLVHLTEVGCLSFLHIFGALHIPDAVWSETVEQGRVSQSDVLELSNAQRHKLSKPGVLRFIQKNNLEALHDGEQECLYLCRQMDVSVMGPS